MTPKEFSDNFNLSPNLFYGGSLYIWGSPFDCRMDNYYKTKSVDFDAETNILTIHFSNNEKLSVYNPKDITKELGELRIAIADRVLWEWYHYGKAQTNDNFYYEDYCSIDNSITYKSNLPDKFKTQRNLSISKAAVLFV